MPKYYGIDLGTTNSALVEYDSEENLLTPISINHANLSAPQLLPSFIYFQEKRGTKTTLVGDVAKTQVVRSDENANSKHIFQNFKQYMGTSKEWNVQGKTITPVILSSIILKEIKDKSEEYIEALRNVIITCPSSFDKAKKADIIKAAQLAGIEIEEWSIVDEPTAAALNYDFDGETYLLFFDMGGGALDIDVMEKDLKNDKPIYKSIASKGRESLGGKDWDKELQNIIIEKIIIEYPELNKEDLREDNFFKLMLIEKTEEIKIQLSNGDVEPFLNIRGGDFRGSYEIIITQAEFEQKTEYLLNQAIQYLNNAVVSTEAPLEKIVLVGGATYMPQIKTVIENHLPQFKGKILRHKGNLLSVANGAAKYKHLAGLGSIEKLLKINLFTRGETGLELLMQKGQQLPYSTERSYYTTGDSEIESLSIDVYASENENPVYHMRLRLARVFFFKEGLREKLPANSGFWLTFSIDTNDMLSIEVEEDVNNEVRIGERLQTSVELKLN